MKYENRIRGFTLIELIIVVVIVAVLAAVLFAVIGRSRENARRAVCHSNLKQLSLGMMQYLQNNDHHFPVNIFVSEQLQPYVKSEAVFLCPSTPFHGTLCTNHYVTGDLIKVDFKAHKVYAKNDSEITDSAATIMFYEAIEEQDKIKAPVTCGKTEFETEVGIRHFNGANFAFVDGHVKWFDAQGIANLSCVGHGLK